MDVIAPRSTPDSRREVREDPPLIDNRPPEAARFEVPEERVFDARGAIFSALSLLLMTVLSWVMLRQLMTPGTNDIRVLQDTAGTGLWSNIVNLLRPIPSGATPTPWIWLPFAFTVFGAGLGFLFEGWLLLSGTPFQSEKSRFTRFVKRVRFLNLGPVIATILFFTTALMLDDPGLRLALLYVYAALGAGLAVSLFLGGAPALPLVILGTQLFQLLVVILADAPAGVAIGWILAGQAVVQAAAFVVGTDTPRKSTGFHLLSTLSGVLLYVAIRRALEADASFAADVAPDLSVGSLAWWAVPVALVLGVRGVMKSSPMTYNIWRAGLSNLIWSAINFILISAKRFPKPLPLSQVYEDGPPEPAEIRPYYQVHAEFLPQNLAIPSVTKLEGSVTAFGTKVGQVKKLFKMIAMLDHVFPQANVHIPLDEKPRMNVWSNGHDVYPQIFLKTIFGYSLPIPPLKKTPPPALDAFHEGQLLAFLGECGVANTFLEPAPHHPSATLMMDFRFLEQYEAKPDYEPYGGGAYFRVDSDRERLELVSIIAPYSHEEIPVNPMDPSFRHAEEIVLASMYFQVIAGKHLAEIHMTYNLVEVVFHNAFDAQDQFTHPFRTFMYLHLFSHELAEELTTEHLVQEGAVFNQIFALRHDALVDYLNDTYHRFEYGADENFEWRREAVRMDDGTLVPNACIVWEGEYEEIWQEYTSSLIDIIYDTDDDVRSDRYLQDVRRGLLEVMLNGLPPRYDDFQTKRGVARWAADTIHHLVVRHQVYGTTGVRAAMDPRISSTQIPKDRGTPAVDEWRSLVSVGLATACARFTLLCGEDGETFTYLLDGVDERYRGPMAVVFERLQRRLVDLDRKWTEDFMEKEFNYNYFRPTPADLRTGPGY